jgi:hypothetical protein
MADKRTHNIVTFSEDDAIIEAVQSRIGSTDYSAAVRFIIREFSKHADPDGLIFKPTAPRAARAYRKTSRSKIDPANVKGVKRGLRSMEAA